jgi:hypothetical protein
MNAESTMPLDEAMDLADHASPAPAESSRALKAMRAEIERMRSLPGSHGETVARPMNTAPRDGTLLRLLVRFDEHSLDDSSEPQWTIGQNSKDHTEEDVWQFAGWCWEHDHFTEGEGTPIGWLPLVGEPCRRYHGSLYWDRIMPGEKPLAHHVAVHYRRRQDAWKKHGRGYAKKLVEHYRLHVGAGDVEAAMQSVEMVEVPQPADVDVPVTRRKEADV